MFYFYDFIYIFTIFFYKNYYFLGGLYCFHYFCIQNIYTSKR